MGINLKQSAIINGLYYCEAENIASDTCAAIFTTRLGGVSGISDEEKHLSSLNLAFNSGDSHENVIRNFTIAAESQDFSITDIISLSQRHTGVVVTVDKNIARSHPLVRLDIIGDALVTNIKGILLKVGVADCVPILLYDPVKEAVGAVHSGWGGTVVRIGEATVKRMACEYGSDVRDIRAEIGPCIGACCYEVDTPFYERFQAEFGSNIDKYFTTKQNGKYLCDLRGINRDILTAAGVLEENIEVSEDCTMCKPEYFFSHRYSGTKRGAQGAFIGLRNR